MDCMLEVCGWMGWRLDTRALTSLARARIASDMPALLAQGMPSEELATPFLSLKSGVCSSQYFGPVSESCSSTLASVPALAPPPAPPPAPASAPAPAAVVVCISMRKHDMASMSKGVRILSCRISVKCSTNMASPPLRAKCLMVAASREIPSTGFVPLPNSSMRQRERFVLALSIWLIWRRSRANAESGALTDSVLVTRVMMRSVSPMRDLSQGTKLPIWAR
mmetsp:Transcript_16824/g.37339  ORF Transcript_16824/g.37339 Transcript_16824/m.37339 type:complete len:222 (+) Transcript_16824:206-871(+)